MRSVLFKTGIPHKARLGLINEVRNNDIAKNQKHLPKIFVNYIEKLRQNHSI